MSVKNAIPKSAQRNLMEKGDERVFGSCVPNDDGTIPQSLWENTLMPAMLAGRIIETDEASKLLDEPLLKFFKNDNEHVEINIHTVLFLAQIGKNGCNQLWALSGNKNSKRVSIIFDSEDDVGLLKLIAERKNLLPAQLAKGVVVEFLNKER